MRGEETNLHAMKRHLLIFITGFQKTFWGNFSFVIREISFIFNLIINVCLLISMILIEGAKFFCLNKFNYMTTYLAFQIKCLIKEERGQTQRYR